MGAAFGDWNDVMDFLGGNIPPGLEALLAERVLRKVQGANGFPAPSVDLVRVGVAAVLVILAVCLRSVDFAVPAVGQVRAAGEGAGFLWLVGHRDTPPGENEDWHGRIRRTLSGNINSFY